MNKDGIPQADRDRLWRRLMHSALVGKIGATGLARLALSDEDREIRDWFAAEARRLGCEVSCDQFGNMFALLPGRDSSLAPIAIGSHLDTQPSGGRFDGILGVLAGLELIECLRENGLTLDHPLEIINWTNEEGSRFSPAMIGSGGFAGVFAPNYVHERVGRHGVRFDIALNRIGYFGAAESHPFAGYFELHIEQGPVLEQENHAIGVVTGVQAIEWFDAVLTGECCHAGTTPLALRKDPVPALAALLGIVGEIGNSSPGRSLSTVGVIETRPGSRNTVPQEIRLSIDLRHQEDDGLAQMAERLLAAAPILSRDFQIRCEISSIWRSPAVRFDPQLVDHVRKAAAARHLSHRDIVSGAGHDAVYVARVAPTAMIFIPCEDGISHNPRENITPEQAADGVDILLRAVLSFDRAGSAA